MLINIDIKGKLPSIFKCYLKNVFPRKVYYLLLLLNFFVSLKSEGRRDNFIVIFNGIFVLLVTGDISTVFLCIFLIKLFLAFYEDKSY